MTKYNRFINKQSGISSSAIITIIAVAAIGAGVTYYALSNDSSPEMDNISVAKSTELSKQESLKQDISEQTTQPSQVVNETPKVSVDAETFCTQLAEVGKVFNKEYSGGRVRENASFGPKAACSWNGPSVTVFFGENSYHRMSTGFGSEINEDYEGLDFPAFKKETSTTTVGYEIGVKSDKGWTIAISDGRGLKQSLTKEQYNKIATIVNESLNKNY
ncbi:hypothetical protein [Kangiella koreensis]|uniref:Uncharacterized protein n=1 Tax=Kangiella koreensis (strain DSM 16069 / JCM 12317 / KCTC 12182 / SW-125) TaxID=523791 RepID=C7R5P1_KANKD|nr:hypothetical protein [Kangiella koreensis]ACV27215.1 hypothetical protein Kkor_1803 [Kangiella koreensis DSM 16069]